MGRGAHAARCRSVPAGGQARRVAGGVANADASRYRGRMNAPRAPIKPGPHRSGPGLSGSVTLTARRLAPTPNPSRRPMRHPAPSSSRLRAPRRPSPSRRLRRRLPSTPRLARGFAVPATCFTCDFVEWTADAAASFAVPAAEPTACVAPPTASPAAGSTPPTVLPTPFSAPPTALPRPNPSSAACAGRTSARPAASRHRRQCSTHQNRTNRVHGHSPQRRCCCGPPSCGLSRLAATCGRWS